MKIYMSPKRTPAACQCR